MSKNRVNPIRTSPTFTLVTMNETHAGDDRTDEALMLSYRDGDSAAFEELYGRWRGRLYRYLAHQAAEAADELFQDVWLRVVHARAGYEVAARFSTWLFRIAHNRLVDHHRARGRSIVELSGEAGSNAEDDPENDPVNTLAAPEQDSPGALLERREAARHILDCLAALPLPQREAFLMVEEGGMSLEEIGRATGVGRETVKSRLRYALDRLRKCLAALKGRD
jgi:RNA polymerase sigma-70 factor, ECF subfamily